MLIQQSLQNPVGLIQDIPAKLLAEIVIGQRLEAVVVKAAIAGELVTIKLANSLLTIRASEALQLGQRIQLELALENGKPVLKLVPQQTTGQNAAPLVETTAKANPAINNITSNLVKAGQQVAVEVVKVLAENRVLVQTVAAFDNRSQPLAKLAPAIQRFDIDISQLTQRYQAGDKLTVDIISTKPLTINLRPEQAPSREQIIVERLQQLVRQQVDKPSLATIAKAVQNQQVPELVQREIKQLLQQVLDKPAVTKANAFKQALVSSGAFTEKQLISQPIVIKQDFKANILKVIAALETVIAQVSQKGGDAKAVLNKLPAQVQSALAAQGKTPAQLLNILLPAKTFPPVIHTATAQTTPAIASQEQALLITQLLSKPAPSIGQTIAASNRPIPVVLAELQMMLREVEGVHNKLQFNQLSMLKEPDSPNTVASWLFDVPIKDKQNVDLLQLQIDQYRQQAEDELEDIWSVQLRLDTQNLGPVQATVTMHAEDLKIVFRAQRSQSALLLEQNLPFLDAALSKLGVSMSHSSCYCGEIARPVLMSQDIAPTNALVDVSV
ncbi:MAG: flagellar hook-length control protein FliK [Methylophagaceae bacterium]